MIDTYVINLDKDVEKWQTIQQKFSWGLTRIPAIDGSLIEDGPFFTSGFIHGCLMSHRKVWDIIARTDRPALILEDDCHPLDGFDEKLASLMQTLPDDYDVAVLGYVVSDVRGDYLLTAFTAPMMKRRHMKRVNDDWFVPGMFFGLHCYIVSPSGARKLLANRLIYHADFIVSTDTNLHVYCPKETIASQIIHKNHKPLLHYNPYISWDWLMTEPILHFGRSFTLRLYHVVICLLLFMGATIRSGSILSKTILKILVVLCIVHYLSTIGHVSHNLRYGKTQKEKVFDNKEKMHTTLNDAFSSFSYLIVLWIGIKNKMLLPIIDIILLALLLRAIINLFFPMKDPSGVCEEKAVRKYSLFEYCGSLRVSGHIFPSVILAYFMPKLGVSFMVVQTSLILMSGSHYNGDVFMGIALMVIVLYAYQKIILKKMLRCRKENKL